ncbi:MAG: hypothetical protein WD530_01305 [Vicingaceae bacterium]
MKTLKYRSVLGALATAALSVFLFTACEKESDGYNTPQKPDRLSKFKSLTYTVNSSTVNNSASGTFIGNKSNITFTAPGASGNSEVQFTQASGNDNGFTDPMSTESSFVISNGFTLGGGTVSIDGKSYEIDLGFCASSDFFGLNEGEFGEETEGLELFIGISGNFDFDEFEGDTAEMPFDMLLFAFSINGGNNIGSFHDFESGDINSGAFVTAFVFNENEAKYYFSTAGSVDFAGTNVSLSNVQMTELLETTMENFELGENSVPLQGFLECGSLDFEAEDTM